MNIGVKGTSEQIELLNLKFSSKYSLVGFKNKDALDQFDIIFDLLADENSECIEEYAKLEGKIIILSAIRKQLEEILSASHQPLKAHFFGINALPTFLERDLMEMTSLKNEDRVCMEKLASDFEWDIQWVSSRVGMATPRIVLMIINEAFYTVQEGTATKEDIDLGMKLGTAYPFGPFEWCNKIGITYVYKTLEALYNDTKEERYKICPLLKTTYLQALIK